jgi:hypothetical protein
LAISYRQVRGLWEAPSLLDEWQPMAAQWMKLTEPNGDPVWLNPNDCSRVRRRDPTATKGAQSTVEGGFGRQDAIESVETIMKILSKC